MQSEPEKSPPAIAYSSLTSRALASSLLVIFCVWLCVATITPLSFRSTQAVSVVQAVNLETAAVATSDLNPLVPLFNILGVHQIHSELALNQTLQNLLHALSNSAKSPPAAATVDGADSLHEATNQSAFTTALANTLKIPSTQLCHFLEDDITSFNTQQKVLVAGLLTNTEALMPHYILQLLKYATAMPPGNVFVTIYESGSTDLTGLSAASKLMQPVQLQQHCY